ncbi:hypothetical protein [Desulfocicer niacini]
MPDDNFFNEKQLCLVQEAVSVSEDLVSNYYKMSSAQWIRSCYEVKTAKDLDIQEQVHGPFAQVVGYRAQKKNGCLGSSCFDFYRICIQDQAILSVIENQAGLLKIFPFLLYILVHELVHIVRFARFQQIYDCASEAECAMEEERLVHGITFKILRGTTVAGMEQVFVYYRKWRCVEEI